MSAPQRRFLLLAFALLATLFAVTPRFALAAEVEHATPAAAGEHGENEPAANLLRPANESAITAVTTLIVFLILVFVLGKFAWGPIATGLKAREDKIRKDIADAEAARARAEATLREYNTKLASAEAQIREMLSKATADAENIATNIRARAQQESEEIKERANRDIETARDQAIGQIHNEAVNLATSIAEKILHRNLNPDDQRDLLARSLEQLQTISRN
jgi:F-type H+-transporting ATPase subunit b